MKIKFRYLAVAGLMLLFSACHQEDALTPEYEYEGAVPAIPDGPSAAQKLCYELYQKYDLQVYYTLSGQEALRTLVGWAQENFNELVLPLQAGEESVSASFLTLLKKFYDLLPSEMVKSTMYKRHILVKGTIASPWLFDFFTGYRSIAQSEDAQGIVFYGNMDEESGIDLELWKYSITYEYFRSVTEGITKMMPLAVEFGKVSKGQYRGEQKDWWGALDAYFLDISYEGEMQEYTYYKLDEEALMRVGFVSPQGWSKGDSKMWMNEDLATYATWIALYPKAERQTVLDTYPLVKKKYDLTLKYFREVYRMDLENFSAKWLVVSLEDQNV